MEIATKRCAIRPFEEGDLDDFMTYRNDEAWMRYQGFKGLAREAYAKALLRQPDLGQGAQFAIVHTETGRLIGDLYLRQAGDAVWIGYTVCPAQARQGYAFEAVSAALSWLAKAGIRAALADVEPENTASIRLLEKLGFQYTGSDDQGERIYRLELNG